MKLKRYKLLCGFMLGAAVMAEAVGCGSGAAQEDAKEEMAVSENSFSYEDDDEEAPVSETVMGRVEKIEDNEVTLTVGGGPSGGQPGEKPFEREEGTTEMGEFPSQNQPSEEKLPVDEQNMEKPESKSAVLTITDESVITMVQTEDGKSAKAGSFSDITEGAMLSVTFDETGAITGIAVSAGMEMPEGAPGGMGGASAGVDSYDAVTEYTEDATAENQSFTSTGTDENAVLISEGASVTLKNITLDRTSSDSTGGDQASFYGVGAGLLAIEGRVSVENSEITTDSAGGAGIFAYGSGIVQVSDTKISTKQDTSGGIHAAGGGTVYAENLDVTTEGESAAAIRSDRGGGTIVAEGGTYTSHGAGSPAVYCTADIAVKSADLTATGSEAICMEGLNSIHLYDCSISGNMSDDSQNDTTWTMIVYQSMSGDSEIGNSTMQIVGGNIRSENGGLLYTTNTECSILFSDVDITSAEDSEFFLQCTGNNNRRGWGSSGNNGSQCTFTADDQEMDGDVIWDSISTLDFYMQNKSTLTGAFVNNESYAGNGGEGYANLTISADSVWNVTGDSMLTNLSNEGTIQDAEGRTVTIQGTDGTVYVNGDSQYTITVDSYSETGDFSKAATIDKWENLS